MLSLRAFPRCINHYFKQSQLHTSVKLLNTNDSSSSSSSSDSSDSDSDKEGKVEKKQVLAKETAKKEEEDDFLSSEKMNERLNNLLLSISKNSKVKVKEAPVTYTKQENKSLQKNKSVSATLLEESKKADSFEKPTAKQYSIPVLTPGVIDVAIKHRSLRFPKQKEKKKEPIEQQIVGAAKDVAQSMGDDSGKTEAELLGQILNLGSSEAKENKTVTPKEDAEKPSLTDLLSNMKVAKPSTVLEDYKEKTAKLVRERFSESSISLSLLQQKDKELPSSEIKDELNGPYLELNIFKDLSEKEPENIPRLTTWEEMEKREIKIATLRTPQNIFQELIQWTDQGKLWHFPIDNEQGMEEDVHFSEHVFLEPHLKGWCPKKGPIRHFMELVCIGLSKNPYMTVEEKVGHIKWYQNYFEDKKDLLNELGILDNKAPSEPKQIEA